MTVKQRNYARLVPVLIIAVITILAGCAVKKEIKADPKTGVNLTYQVPGNQALQYAYTLDATQKVEVMGQTQETKIKQSSKFSVQAKGFKEKNLLLGITLDAQDMKAVTPQMNLTSDISSLNGKTFDMVLSPLGKELELIGTEELQYELKPIGEKQNASSPFKAIFPDLAGRTVKIGDTWTSQDDFKDKGGGFEVHFISDNTHTLEGTETVNQMDCIKVSTKITGTIEGKGKQRGVDMSIKGTLTGTASWYFAYEKGIFVKDNTDLEIKSNVVIPAQGMTIPLTMQMKIEVTLL
jgi:hypothetical protein